MKTVWALSACLLLATGTEARDLNTPLRSWALPKALSEVSGLAVASDDSVFAHGDEHGVVYEIRLSDGKPVRAFALGTPTVKADFEGIAVDDGRVYLITSTGLIHEADIGAHRERVRFNIYDTGVGAFCEIEGLAVAEGVFLIACKARRDGGKAGELSVYRWSPQTRSRPDKPWRRLSAARLLSTAERKAFLPSGIEWDAASRRLYILAAKARAYLTLTADGRLDRKRVLSHRRHRQAEGITVMPDGRLVIADEGGGIARGRLTVYAAED
ncbi:MAG: SdiA-regulated domain-containing protein [Pacificimonas sp.]